MPSKKTRAGILCLETIWFDEVENPSTRNLLEFLELLSGTPFVHRNMCTSEELDFQLGRWVGRRTYQKDYVLGDYSILYLGFHGGPAEISLRDDLSHARDQEEVDLEIIADSLDKDANYDCEGTVIHFASCSVLRAHSQVKKFKERVGAACVSGYTRVVDSILSWSFELMYLDMLSNRESWSSGTLQTLEKKIQDKSEYSGLASHLGFKMIY